MPKLATPLTDVQVKNAKAKDKPYKLADGGGMYLEVMPTGSKFWRLSYRQVNGKANRLTFGSYPETTLGEAREKRTAARRLLNDGIDPAKHRDDRRRLAEEKAAHTFEKVAREWHQNKIASWSLRTAKNTLHRLEVDIFPAIGRLPIAEVSHQQLIVALRKIEARGAHEVAHRIKATCAQVFSYAIQSGLADRNPAADMKDVLRPVAAGHFAAIDTDALPTFLSVLNENEARMLKPTRIALRLMMLIFVRTSELIETPWSEIDLEKGEWIIPWQRMKRGKLTVNPDRTNHHVCLSAQALALLHDLHTVTGGGKFLFPNQRDHERPLSNNAILKALERMGYKGQMTGHGFRALAMSTIKERLGYRHEVVDRQLAHAQKDKVASAYDRAQFLAERKVMMQQWADYLDGVASGNTVAGKSGRQV
ncbi:MAG: integrase [Herminiimonas sp.]|nr:integrase [Herminiimonas sp.]